MGKEREMAQQLEADYQKQTKIFALIFQESYENWGIMGLARAPMGIVLKVPVLE